MEPGSPAERRVAALPCWKGDANLVPLKGGVSNASFKVTDSQGAYVARVGHDYPFHQVYRDTELAASNAAFEAGLSPEVVYTEPGIMVVRFIEARTYGEADVRANASRCVDIVKRCHRDMGKLIHGRVGCFWVFQVIRFYLRQISEVGHPHSMHAERWHGELELLEAAQMPLPIVFAHHDLLPTNFMDDGKRLWLIDWEYGGFGTCMFDLANISANNQFTDEDDEQLLEAYFERKPEEALWRSFHAMKVASTLREATWGMISELNLASTGINYADYTTEYLGRYARAMKTYTERFGK